MVLRKKPPENLFKVLFAQTIYFVCKHFRSTNFYGGKNYPAPKANPFKIMFLNFFNKQCS